MTKFSSPIVPVIPIARDASRPLHRQIYEGFQAAILRGDLCAGQRVPSSRELAATLAISRFPVLDAYAQLLAERYFESRSGSGTFISASIPGQIVRRKLADGPNQVRAVSRRSLRLPRFEPSPWIHGWGAFGVHQPALDQFPFKPWSRIVARHARAPRLRAIHHIDPLGLERFREAICSYLRTARAVQCDPQQIMVVSGSQQALEITARVLLDPGDTVWIEEPGYQLARSVLVGTGCRLVPVPVDEEGLDVSAGLRQSRRARAVFVTPSHQYPLGVTLSAPRRLELLNWAQDAGAWIVEDDYDSEYMYESMPIPSLQGLDSYSRVIYIGTFSKVLFPSLRLGYIVIPPDLIDRFMAVRFALDIFPPYLFQEAMADFMGAGYFARHIRRMRSLYKERRASLAESLRREFGHKIQIHGAEAGMHLTVTLPSAVRDLDVSRRAARRRLWLWPLSTCYMGEKRSGFILGFGSTPSDQMPAAVARLREVLDEPPEYGSECPVAAD